jgi:L-threonylcarbamoyladenylate synthase
MTDLEIENIIKVLRSGGTILYPTDTVWGIGCDATNSMAVKRIHEIKKINVSKSMLILTDSINNLYNLSDFVPDIAIELIRLSDSPISIIYPMGKNIAPELIAEDSSVGIRVTNEQFTKKLISKFKKPVVATSANLSDEKAPVSFKDIDKYIIKEVDYVVKYKQNQTISNKPSGIIKFYLSGDFKIIRK